MIQAIRIRMVPATQWIAVFLALGLILRATGLTVQSLWIDEVASVITVDQATPGFLSQLFGTIASEANQPLYFVLLHFWTRLFGISDLALRSLSALFSIAAMFVFSRWALCWKRREWPRSPPRCSRCLRSSSGMPKRPGPTP